MRPEPLFRLALLGLCAVALSACQTFREQAGLTKQPPDEFAVVTKAPLIIPPDYNLRPPSPGAPPLNQQDPTSSAQAALFSNSDPATVASNMRGPYSPAERLLLANARTQNASPTIRSELQSDARTHVGADPGFVDRVLNGVPTPTAAPAAGGKAPAAKSGGWFDWF